MREGDFRISCSVTRLAFLLAGVVACSSSDSSATRQTATAAPSVTPAAASGSSACPNTGKWAACSVVYRLVRAGVAPRVDSTAKPEEKRLTGQSFVIKIGQFASLDVFLYSDSAARKSDEAKLDTAEFVNGTAPQTMRRERTLIVNNNLIGLLTSLNAHQRERVSDALTAGAPQPNP
jgi:hypothetical protein